MDTGGPFVSAVTVCGDEPVLLSISGAAVDLVFPAWLRGTFDPRAARKKELPSQEINLPAAGVINCALSIF